MKFKKIALIFPGQGSQYSGMGKELYDKFQIVKEVYDEAASVLGYDIAGKCFKKPHLASSLIHRADLDRTIFTQPAVMVTSYACYKIFEKMCADADIPLSQGFLAGHSLGEYTALAVSGAMDFRTCLDLVNKRATYITEFSNSYPNAGLMAIVNRGSQLDFDMIVNLAREAQVYITLINTRNQIVVGGFKKNLEELAKTMKKEGLIATALKVEGPFHTPLMKPAADRFKEDLDRVSVYIASKPIIANVSVDAIVDPGHIRKELYEQIYTCVDWQRTIDKMIGNGTEIFIEVGPKKVLNNMIKDIDPSILRFNVEDPQSLETTVKELAAQLEH